MWMRHVAWCPWHGMIKLLCQDNDIPTDLQSKTGCLALKPSFSFSTAQKIFIYTPQSNSLAGKVKLKCFQNGTQCLNFGLGSWTFYFGLRQRLHVRQSNRQSSSQSKALFRHYRINQTDANKFHISFIFFQNVLTVSFAGVVKWSPSGESGRQLQNPLV